MLQVPLFDLTYIPYVLTGALHVPKPPFSAIQGGCYLAAGVVLGRKVSQCAAAGVCKISSQVAALFQQNEASQKLSHAGDRYMTLAKEHLVRDLTVATAFVAAGFAAIEVKDFVDQKFSGKGEFSGDEMRPVAINGCNSIESIPEKDPLRICKDMFYGTSAAGGLFNQTLVDTPMRSRLELRSPQVAGQPSVDDSQDVSVPQDNATIALSQGLNLTAAFEEMGNFNQVPCNELKVKKKILSDIECQTLLIWDQLKKTHPTEFNKFLVASKKASNSLDLRRLACRSNNLSRIEFAVTVCAILVFLAANVWKALEPLPSSIPNL
jgi:hypothetical protein